MYTPPSTVKLVKSRKMRSVGNVTLIGRSGKCVPIKYMLENFTGGTILRPGLILNWI